MKPAVLVIDMLEDFIRGSLKCDRAEKIIPKIQSLLEAARRKGIPIIYVCDAHLPEVDLELALWGPHALIGTPGAQVIPELKPQPSDYQVQKRRYSGFFQTSLDMLLKELGVETLILTGIHTHLCVLYTAADGFFRGYKLLVPEDCVEAADEEEHRWALNHMEKYLGARVISLEKLLKILEGEA
ncbi:MAG: cysteine hydrolase family protein [Candidatus Hecatellaceae archaeon]